MDCQCCWWSRTCEPACRWRTGSTWAGHGDEPVRTADQRTGSRRWLCRARGRVDGAARCCPVGQLLARPAVHARRVHRLGCGGEVWPAIPGGDPGGAAGVRCAGFADAAGHDPPDPGPEDREPDGGHARVRLSASGRDGAALRRQPTADRQPVRGAEPRAGRGTLHPAGRTDRGRRAGAVRRHVPCPASDRRRSDCSGGGRGPEAGPALRRQCGQGLCRGVRLRGCHGGTGGCGHRATQPDPDLDRFRGSDHHVPGGGARGDWQHCGRSACRFRPRPVRCRFRGVLPAGVLHGGGVRRTARHPGGAPAGADGPMSALGSEVRRPAGSVGLDGSAWTGRRGPLRWGGWLLLIAVGYLLPWILGGSDRIVTTCVLIAIFAIMSYGLDLVLSYLGEVSLGHTLLWAAGAYLTAITAVRLGWSPIPALLAALAAASALASVLGLATIRTREFVFSLVTYAAAVIGLTVVSNSAFFGGTDGLVGIPLLSLPALDGQYVARSNADFWPIAYLALVLVIALISRFRHSKLGVTALMAQMNPDLATSLGVDVRRTRVLVFVLSAPVAALAGWLYAYQRSYVSPDLLSPYFLLFMLTAVILPGRRLLLGPLVGAVLLTSQQELASLGGDADKIVLGGVLAAVLLLSPDGLAGIWRRIMRRGGGRKVRTAGDEAEQWA